MFVAWLTVRAAFEHFVRVSAAERRRAERLLGGGSLGRSFSRSYGTGLSERRSPPTNVQPLTSPIQENITSITDKDKRRASLRVSMQCFIDIVS